MQIVIFSQLTILENEGNQDDCRSIFSHPSVAHVMKWSASKRGRELLEQESAVGSHFSHPPLSTTLDQYMNSTCTPPTVSLSYVGNAVCVNVPLLSLAFYVLWQLQTLANEYNNRILYPS